MGARRDFEDAVIASVAAVMPTLNLIVIDGNGPEPVTPYATLEVPFFQAIGREEVSTGVSGVNPTAAGVLTVKEVYEATARFSFVGRNESSNDGADLAFDFSTTLVSPRLQMKFRENSLSYMRKAIVRRIPKFRETRWYDAYVLDVVFAFVLETTQQIDNVESISITGSFQPDNLTTEIIIP